MKKNLINLSVVFALVFSAVNIQADFLSDAGNWMGKHKKEIGIGLGVAAGLGAAGAGAYYGGKRYKDYKSSSKPYADRVWRGQDGKPLQSSVGGPMTQLDTLKAKGYDTTKLIHAGLGATLTPEVKKTQQQTLSYVKEARGRNEGTAMINAGMQDGKWRR